MGVPGNANTLLLKSAAAGGAYEVSRSLRFNGSIDNSYLSRTPASAGNRKTFTFAVWVKRSVLGGSNEQTIFSEAQSTGNDPRATIRFATGNAIEIGFNPTGSAWSFLTSTAVYRDLSAWLHLVVSVDTTQATASNRTKVYINGSQITTWSTEQYVNQNTDLPINLAQPHAIGRYEASPSDSSYFFNGYLADIHFIDGQALDPSSFTETDATTGQLIPIAYTGSYGTNGFKLNFSNNSTTAALGTDTSGNGNTWTVNNFSVAPSGSTAVTVPATNAPPSVEYLVIGGGGGGGATHGGGGGAGGYRSSVSGESSGGGASAESPLSVTAGASYSVTVGAGGTGGSASDGIYVGSAGTNSVFGSITSNGGAGAGGGASGQNATSGGGSGGGAGNRGGASNGTANQGFNGGTGTTSLSGEPAGGGGGAGSNGSNGTSGQAGNGGSGVSSSITGTSIGRAGGGGGAISVGTPGSATSGGGAGGNPTATAGTANTGGGGGGGGSGTAGQPGGSGVVIIRYANTYSDLSVGGGLTYTLTNTGGYKIYTFTASSTPAQAAGNDSLVDTPTSYGTDTGVGGEVRGNYATWNPLAIGSVISLANGNLDFSSSSSASFGSVIGTIGTTSGKWYWEVTMNADRSAIGIAKNNVALSTNVASDANAWMYQWTGNKSNNNIETAYGAAYTTSDVIGVAFDADNGTLTFYKNGSTQGQAFSGLTSGPYFPIGSDQSSGGTGAGSLNTGQRAFAYTAPSGFKALCDTNLPTPVVAKPNDL
jgi:hypothetical protein